MSGRCGLRYVNGGSVFASEMGARPETLFDGESYQGHGNDGCDVSASLCGRGAV